MIPEKYEYIKELIYACSCSKYIYFVYIVFICDIIIYYVIYLIDKSYAIMMSIYIHCIF